MDKNSHRFLIVDDLFKRYTVVVDIFAKETAAYCDECREWVFKQSGDHLSTHTEMELFEYIVNKHDENKHGVRVEIKDPSKDLSVWQE